MKRGGAALAPVRGVAWASRGTWPGQALASAGRDAGRGVLLLAEEFAELQARRRAAG